MTYRYPTGPRPRSAGPRRPRKILIIVADQLRADALGAYGNRLVRTPHLDRLAARGTLFARHYSVTAPCGPARTSLLTGLRQAQHGVISNTAPSSPDLPNIATVLAGAGIKSHVVGYTDSILEPGGEESLLPGFTWHTRFNLNDDGLRGWLDALRAAGHRLPQRPMDVFRSVPGEPYRAVYDSSHSDTAYVADRTVACLRERRDESWLILSTFLRPHPPWVAPPPYDTLYDPGATAAPRRLVSRRAQAAVHPFVEGWTGRSALDTDPKRLTESAVARARAVYLGLVTELDHHVGRILAALRETGQDKDTLIVFTADHGDTLGDHWTLGTGGFAESAYRVPLIIVEPAAGAARAPRRVVREVTESTDVVPTLLDWAGLDALPDLTGRSLLPPAAGGPPGRFRRYAYCTYDFRSLYPSSPPGGAGPEDLRLVTVRDLRHTYVHFPTLPPLLFDRRSDPGELHDLAGDPRNRPLLDAFAARVRTRERASGALHNGGTVVHG